MSFIRCGSETRIYRVSSGNKLDGYIASSPSFKNQKHKIENNIFESIFFEAPDH